MSDNEFITRVQDEVYANCKYDESRGFMYSACKFRTKFYGWASGNNEKSQIAKPIRIKKQIRLTTTFYTYTTEQAAKPTSSLWRNVHFLANNFKHFVSRSQFAGLFVHDVLSLILYTRRRIIRLYEISSVICLLRRRMEHSSSGRIMRLVPVFISTTQNHTDKKYLLKFVQAH